MKTKIETTKTAVRYSVDITECKVCNKLTNLIFKTFDNRLIVACCQEHADQIAGRKYK